ncbi:MAG: MalY/PatB family protein [Acidimicrobiales bacterium]
MAQSSDVTAGIVPAPPAHPFDKITVDELTATGGMKWTRYGPGVIGAFVAEMDFGTDPAITDALHADIDTGTLGYLPTALRDDLARATADFMAARHQWPVPAEWVHPIPDVIRGFQVAIEHFSAPGSAIVLPTPAYMPFLSVPPQMGRDIIRVPMPVVDGRYVMDLEGIDRALAGDGDLVVLCNPQNPTGRVFEPGELEALASVVDDRGGRVFADEIHAPLVYGERRHVPYASVSAAAARHSVTATSASKAWNLPGLKAAQLLLTNEVDAERWTDIGFLAGHGASNLGVIANTVAYRDGGPWLAEVLDYLDTSRRYLADLVAAHLPGAGMHLPEGTYLAWIDVSGLELGDRPADTLLDRAGVALIDGRRCGTPGFVRINFATPRPILADAVERLGAAVNDR